MTLQECMTRVSYSEYLIWIAYFELQLEDPSRTDLYLMQIACEIVRSRVKNPRGILLKDFVLKLNRREPKTADLKTITAHAKSVWAVRLGKPFRRRTKYQRRPGTVEEK